MRQHCFGRRHKTGALRPTRPRGGYVRQTPPGLIHQVHCSHRAEFACVGQEFSAWGVEADFSTVSAHSAATLFVAPVSGVIVVDAVVIRAQHGQI